MKALSIRQPWADAIAHQTKRVENRTWPTAYRGPVLIHASATHDPYAVIYGPRPDVRSAILAVARITDCHYSDDGRCCGPWGDERVHHWTLTDVTTLPEPVPCKGRLGLWTPPPDVLLAIADSQERTPA
ncbi:ASCH domain-containing protein [Streptomyces sp. NPDC002144]